MFFEFPTCEQQKTHTIHFFFFGMAGVEEGGARGGAWQMYIILQTRIEQTLKTQKFNNSKTIYDILTKFYSKYVYMMRNIFENF